MLSEAQYTGQTSSVALLETHLTILAAQLQRRRPHLVVSSSTDEAFSLLITTSDWFRYTRIKGNNISTVTWCISLSVQCFSATADRNLPLNTADRLLLGTEKGTLLVFDADFASTTNCMPRSCPRLKGRASPDLPTFFSSLTDRDAR